MILRSFRATSLLLAVALTGMVQAPPQGPAAYWKLDETASPAANQVGAFSAGTWYGPVVSTNVPVNTFVNPRSLSFDGVDDYVEFANSAQLENIQENSYTLSAWFNPTDIPVAGTNEGRYAILYKAGWHEGISYNRDGNGNGQFVFEHWLTGNVWEGVGGPVHAPGSWYHVAGVVNLPAGTTQLYVNGVLEGTNTWTPNTASRDYGTNPWRIGSANPAAAYGSYRWAAKGLIDEPRIYSRALSLDEISILASGVPMVQAPVVATGGVQQVTVTWNPPATPAGYTGYTYNIYRSIDGGAFTPLASGVSGTTYVDTTATTTGGPGPTYTYQVTAVSVAESGTMISTSAIPTLPPPRTNDHDEGFLDGDCACGSTAGGPGPAGLALAVCALVALLRRRPTA